MTQVYDLQQSACAQITVAQSPEELNLISDRGCPGLIWNRRPLDAFQSWIDRLDPERLPSGRSILRPYAVKEAVSVLCDNANTPPCDQRAQLIDDISALAAIFSNVMKAPYLRVRLARITTNACRKFHTDAVTARLICTYRGAGTQYGQAVDGTDPKRIFTVPTGAPVVLRGALWPETPRSGLLHRSPPIDGSGETRLVLVLDPVFDPEDEM